VVVFPCSLWERAAGADDEEEARDAEKLGPFQLRLKFGKQAYCVVELRRGEEAAEVAKKLRDLAAQVEARKS
jgi:hypothetical protein